MWLVMEVAPFSGAMCGEFREVLVNTNSIHTATVVKIDGKYVVRVDSATGAFAVKSTLAEFCALLNNKKPAPAAK
jgi:hypothetical protein